MSVESLHADRGVVGISAPGPTVYTSTEVVPNDMAIEHAIERCIRQLAAFVDKAGAVDPDWRTVMVRTRPAEDMWPSDSRTNTGYTQVTVTVREAR